MKIMTSDFLESTAYRCLFEYAKKEGIAPIFELIQDVKNLPCKSMLILQTIMEEKNALTMLAEKNKDVIKYFKEHKEELTIISLEDENLYNTVNALLNNNGLLDLYLDNAKKLEELKIKEIEFVKDLNSITPNGQRYYCEFWTSNRKEIKEIHKFYTDGKVFPRLTEEQAYDFKWFQDGYNKIPFSITNERETSFVLKTENGANFRQDRKIEIIDFGFDGSKLPTVEEVQSYEIPRELIKKKVN